MTTSAALPSLNLKDLDILLDVLEGHAQEVRDVRAEVQAYSRPAASKTGRRRRKRTDKLPPDLRAKLELRTNRVIIGATNLLELIQGTEPLSTGGKRSLRSSKGRTLAVEKHTAPVEEEQPAPEDADDCDDEDEYEAEEEETATYDEQTIADDERTAADEEMVANDEMVQLGEEGLSQVDTELRDRISPLAPDPVLDSTATVFTVPTYQCELTDLGLYTVSTKYGLTTPLHWRDLLLVHDDGCTHESFLLHAFC